MNDDKEEGRPGWSLLSAMGRKKLLSSTSGHSVIALMVNYASFLAKHETLGNLNPGKSVGGFVEARNKREWQRA